MGIFSRFEHKAEDVIEGSGGRGRGGIEPVKLAKRASKEMEREKMVGVGHEYAPTLYNVLLSPEDDASMSGYYPSLAGEIETYLTSQGAKSGLVFDCPPLARFIVDEGLKRGKFDIIAESVSPAIIRELRHEEMVRYGLERGTTSDFADAPQNDQFDAPAPRAVHPAEQPMQRNYPPAEQMAAPYDDPLSPAPVGAAAAAATVAQSADRTVMLDDVVVDAQSAILFDIRTQRSYRLRNDRTIIGRENTCDVIIPDPSVSRRHAEILHNETGWLIRDTGSTNGVIVNGMVTTQSRIYDGDLIELGTTQLEFQEG